MADHYDEAGAETGATYIRLGTGIGQGERFELRICRAVYTERMPGSAIVGVRGRSGLDLGCSGSVGVLVEPTVPCGRYTVGVHGR